MLKSTKILVALLCITSVEPSKGNGKGEKASENSGLREIAAKIEKIETAIGKSNFSSKIS